MIARRLWIIFYSSLMLLASALSLVGGFLVIVLEINRADPARLVEFRVGPLRFRVANAFLVFPWGEGESPETDQALVAQMLQRQHRPTPSSGIRSLSLKFDLPDLSPGTLRNDRRVIADVEYMGMWPIPDRTLAEMAGYHDARTIITPSPDFDTARYAAFHITLTPAFAQKLKSERINIGVQPDDIRFISRSGSAPREVDCRFPNLPRRSPGDCHTELALFTDRFPPVAGKKPPFTLGLTIPPGRLDDLPAIIDAVTAKLNTFIVAEQPLTQQ